jgi:hypothetical protein
VTPGQAIPQRSTEKECRDYSHINESPEGAIRVQLTEEGEVCVTPGQAIPQISTQKESKDYSHINESPERAIRVQPGVSPKGVTPGQAIPQISTLKECKEYSHINESPERAIRVQPGVSPKGVTPGQAIPQISTLKVCRDYSPIIPAQNNSDADNTDSNVLPDLDETHLCILKMLLDGQSVKSFLATRRLMPSIVADTINEALWDLIGDNVLECDGDNISVIEDYRDDVKSIFQ